MNQETMSIAEAKKHFSDLVGKVAYGKKRFIITKRGKPMALLTPADEGDRALFPATGWLEENDPFFETMDRIVRERDKHKPRG